MHRSFTRPLLTIAALGIALASSLTLGSVNAAPARADAGVGVHVVDRPDLVAVADPTYLTEVQLSGTGFQSIVNGHGGVYVLFGWVDGGSWRPSLGGTTGTNYRYVPDDETNPTGYAVFVAFPGGDTAYAANGGELSADGGWSAVMSIPGAQFETYDRDGNATSVNCLQVQCGIITIGAHGVVNANNETFTPIEFRDLYSAGEQPAAPTEVATAAPAPAPEPTVVTTTIVAEAAATDGSGDDGLVQVVLWVAVGVGVLAVAAVVFLVWAVLSGRRRGRASGAEGGAAAGGAA